MNNNNINEKGKVKGNGKKKQSENDDNNISTSSSLKKENERQKLITLYNKTCFNSKMSILFADITQSVHQYSNNISRSRTLLKQAQKSTYNIFPKKLSSPSQQTKFPFLTSSQMMKSQSLPKISFLQTKLSSNKSLSNLKLKQDLQSTKTNLLTKSHTSKSASTNSIFDIYTRKKNFKIKYERDWYKKNGLPTPNDISPNVLCDKEYQRTIITNEITILLDNISKFKVSILEMISAHIHSNDITQVYVAKLNMIIEETCGLLLAISNDLLFDLEKYLYTTNMVSPVFPKEMIDNNDISYDEIKSFDVNIKIFNECLLFVSSSYEMFLLLSKQIDDYVIDFSRMKRLKQFLSRARLTTSAMSITAKRYANDCDNDNDAFDKYFFQMTKSTNDKIEERKNVLKDMNERFRDRLKMKFNEEVEKNRRLNNALWGRSNDKEFEEKKRIVAKKNEKHIDLSSRIFSKMMMYMTPERKKEIMGERLLQQFKNHTKKNKDKNKFISNNGISISQ